MLSNLFPYYRWIIRKNSSGLYYTLKKFFNFTELTSGLFFPLKRQTGEIWQRILHLQVTDTLAFLLKARSHKHRNLKKKSTKITKFSKLTTNYVWFGLNAQHSKARIQASVENTLHSSLTKSIKDKHKNSPNN